MKKSTIFSNLILLVFCSIISFVSNAQTTLNIPGPDSVCVGDVSTYTFSPDVSGAAISWTADGGQIDAQSSQNVSVTWNNVDESGFGYLTYHNVCQPCAGETTVKIPVVTDNAAIQGPANVCANSVYYYSMPQWPGTNFDWSLSGDTTEIMYTDQPNVFSIQTADSGSFTINVRACNGVLDCYADTSIVVTISPEAIIEGEEEVCIDTNHEYTLSNASTANWTLISPSGTVSTESNEASIEPTFTEEGIYTLEISGDFCSQELFQITVHPIPPVPEIFGPDSICIGIPTQYSATQFPGTTTYWFPSSGTASPSIGSNTSITFNAALTLWVRSLSTDIPGCNSNYTPVTIHSIAPTSITLSTNAPDPEICGSSQWEFDVDYTGGDLYQWEILDPAMGSIVAGNNSPHVEVLFNNPINSPEDVDVIVAVTKCGETLRDTLTMTVVNAPSYTATVSDTIVCAGEEVDFTISPTPGSGDITWEFGDGGESSTANTSYIYPNNTSVAVFNPVATIVGPEGCSGTAIVSAGSIEVMPAPVALVSPVAALIGCDSISAVLTATVSTGFGSTSNFEWFGPSTNPPDCTTCDTWTIDEFGDHSVVVENSNGCRDTSNVVHVIENCESTCPGPKPYLLSADSTFIDCAEVKANINYANNGLNIVSENWDLPDEATSINLEDGFNAYAEASFEKAGVYPFFYNVVYGEGDSLCEIEFIQEVYVPFVGDMLYEVSCGAGNFYDITLYDHSNVFPTEEDDMVHKYAYYDGTTWTTITAPDDTLSVSFQLPAGDYEFREIIYSDLTLAAPPCTTIIDNINLPAKPDADFEIVSPFEPACINDVVVHFNNLSTPATGLQYVWGFGGGITNYQSNPDKVFSDITPSLKTITLTATNEIGCTDSTQNTIEIEDNNLWDGIIKPTITTDPTPPACAGVSIELEYFSSTFPPPYFTWYQGSTPITPVVTASSLDVTQEGQYWVMGSDDYGCLVPSDPASVFFTPIQIPTIIGNPAQCDDVPFTLTSSITEAGGITLEWERIPGGVVGTGATLDQELTVGTYTYTLTATQNGCEGVSVPFTVTVGSPVDPPTVSFDITSCDPYVVELTASNTQSGTYHWSNGTTGATVNGFSGGQYEVYFTSLSGCTSHNLIIVPNSPQEYIWTFPTGCFCPEDLHVQGHHICAAQSTIFGPIIPFDFWSYEVNGTSVSSGSGTVPTPLTNFGPDSVNLILDNGFCEITSDAMYISDSCSTQSQQSLQELVGSEILAGDSNFQTETINPNGMSIGPKIILIPNPASGQTRVQFRFDGSTSHRTIEIFDMTGRKVNTLRPQTNSGSITLQLGDFRSGIYQVCLSQDGRVIAQSKLSVAP